MNSIETAHASLNSAFTSNYGDRSLTFVEGKGLYVFDESGKKHLDFGSGIAVSALGHGDPDLIEAICNQAKKIIHTSNLYHTVPAAKLAARLTELSGFAGVFFCNSGTEANEAALKFVRLVHFREEEKPQKSRILCFENAFHGRTFGSLSATANQKYRDAFQPLLPGFEFLPFNHIEAFENALDERVAGVIVEPVQGEGGVTPATVAFLNCLRKGTERHGSLLIFDEIQCSLGRTGELFAFQKYQIRPDIITLAKPLAGGLPIGAVLVNERVKKHIAAGDHGSTFGGNPVCAAAALCVIDKILQLRLPQKVRELTPFFESILKDLVRDFPNYFATTRGSGFLRAIDCHIPAQEIIKCASHAGLLILAAGTKTLRFAPPLIAEKKHFMEMDEKLRTAIAALSH